MRNCGVQSDYEEKEVGENEDAYDSEDEAYLEMLKKEAEKVRGSLFSLLLSSEV